MSAADLRDLRATLRAEAAELTRVRDRLRVELADIEAQLDARQEAAASLGVIRPVPEPSAPASRGRGRSTGRGRKTAAATTTKSRPATRARRRPAAGTTAPARSARRKDAAQRGGTASRTRHSSGRPVRTHLRDEIISLLGSSKGPMTVRELTEALGEPTTKSRLESVRTSAENLVKAGRANKTGRGLFSHN